MDALRDPANPGIEASYREAIAVSCAQGLRSFELRAVTSLARLWSGQGRREEGAALLAVLEGFTEGFDTVDLVEARSVLDALSSTRA